MKKSDFYYDLPERLIAQTPIFPRDSSRLLVYDREKKNIEDKHFYDIVDYVGSGDVLVINNTKVLEARLFGQKNSGARIEFLLHKRKDLYSWEVLCRPAKRAKKGDVFVFSDELKGEITAEGVEGIREIRFIYSGVFEDIISRTGEMPLPHYIHEKLSEKERYQTVYAKEKGSSAAPTAGLHFTNELLDRLKGKGVKICEVLLHVGLGTFRPVKTDDITDHKMHSEYYNISAETAQIINDAKKNGKKVFAVGTTSVRVLETAAKSGEKIEPSSGETDIFIYPPYKFKVVDKLITNFHLPESTLLMLVSAFMGRNEALELYKYAVSREYRFFSFGDACLIL